MLLNDEDIRKYCIAPAYYQHTDKPMIEPFSEGVSGKGVISYGLTSAGYDLRLGTKILVFKNTFNQIIDPKNFKDPEYIRMMFDEITVDPNNPKPFSLPPHSYILGTSLEYLRIPRSLKGRCVGKSTLARCGIIVNTTPLEPSWHGLLTIEIANVTPCPVQIYPMEGIAQLEFETLTGEPETSYADKGGKYQGQSDVTPARVV